MIPDKGKFLLQFSAVWCGPCTALSPVIAKVADSLNVGLQKIDIDNEDNKDIVSQFKIRSIPTVILFEDGIPVDQFIGMQNEQKIRNFINRE